MPYSGYILISTQIKGYHNTMSIIIILNLMTVNGSEEEITIKLNMGVLQTLLETTANDLLEVFKASRQQSDDEVRGKILRELYGIKKALIGSKQHTSIVIDLTQDSEEEDSESEIVSEQSPKVGQKRSHEDLHLSSPPAKRVHSSTPMGNSKTSASFNNTSGSSSANSQDTDDAASKRISESVLRTSQQRTLSRTLSLNSATSSGNTSAESDVMCVNTQANWKDSIPSTSSPIGESSFSGGSSVTFKRSCSKAGSSKSRQKSNQEPANVPNESNTTQGVQQANSKCDESSNGPQPTRNTTNSEKCATGPSRKTGIILLSEKASTSEASTKQIIKDCITYNAQKRAPNTVPDETTLKRKRSRSSSSSEITPLTKKRKVIGSSCSSSSDFDHEEDDVLANSSTAPNRAQLQNASRSSDTEDHSESASELQLVPLATPEPSTQEESPTSASRLNTQPDVSNRSTLLSDNSQPSGKQTLPRFYYCKDNNNNIIIMM